MRKNHPPILKEKKVGSVNKLSSFQKGLGRLNVFLIKITWSIGKCSWEGGKIQNEREVIEPKTIVLSKECRKKKN
jgi:hypothetical protein